VLAERGNEVSYPVAKIDSTGSGSNKFGLAVFVHARTMGPIQAAPEKDACATRQRFELDRGAEEKKNEE
jgi:hypothetical protein